MIKQFAQDLRREFSGYNAGAMTKDLVAGITVTAVSLPLALAFGVSSGADAAAGLITAILAAFFISLLSGASYQISGPTGSMAAVLFSVAAGYGMQGIFLVTLMAGVIRVLCGLFKVGRLVSIIPAPVIAGFTSGIAIIIALGQVDNFFGTYSEGTTAIAKMASYFTLGFHPDWQTMAIGLFVIAVMILWPKKWAFPSSLASLILVLVINAFLKWDVAVVGEIPRTLMSEQRLDFAQINMSMVAQLIGPSVSVAALGMIETLLCGASAGAMTGERLNADRELVAQGIGNIIVPFFGGVPATAALARTSMAIRSGQKTRLTGVFSAFGLLICMFLLSGIMSKIPMAALAGVLMVTAWRMNDWPVIRHLFSHKMRGGMIVFLLTPICTVVFDLSIAILAGVAFSCISFVLKSVDNLEVTVSEVDPVRLAQAHGEYSPRHKNVRVVYISGSLFFGNSHALMEQLEAIESDVDALILSVRGVPTVTSSAILGLQEFTAKKRDQGCIVCFAGTQPAVKQALLHGGLSETLPEQAFFWGVDEALASIK
jgi:SulP family sulfate permease